MDTDAPLPTELPLQGSRCERVDAAANRLRVLEAARRLFRERGDAGVSMEEVAEAAGVGKGTVFRRFGDREGLIEALLDEGMRDFQEAFLFGPPPLGPSALPRERLESFLDGLLELLDGELELLLAARQVSTHPPRLFAALALHLRLLLAQAAPDADAEITADLLLSAVSASMLRRLRRERGRTLGEVQAALRSLLHGLLPGG